nr:PAR1-like protein [Ipomoea batatas]
MDSSMMILFFVGSLFLQGALGDITCEYLPANVCSFAISSSGKRCLLENSVTNEGNKVEYQCKTSEVVVGSSVGEHIETDECVEACGLDRKSVGLSSDSLLESSFTAKLCSSSCYQNCPNIVDLYFNLAAGEGVYLPDLCEKQRSHTRRDMIELKSSNGEMAPGPSSEEGLVGAPQKSPRRAMVELSSGAPSPTDDDEVAAPSV